MEEIISIMNRRIALFETAIDMSTGRIPFNKAFAWPDGPDNHDHGAAENIWEWRGAILELRTILNILQNYDLLCE